jgi:PAS domain S-box-containing protein
LLEEKWLENKINLYEEMIRVNNELVNLHRELVNKNTELEEKYRELKISEEALRESQRLFQEVTNSSPATFWMSDRDGRRTWFNKTWLDFTGRTLAEELGNGWRDDIHPQDLPNYLELFSRAFQLRQPVNLEYRLRYHQAEYRWVYDQAIPKYEAKGDFSGYIGSGLEITDRKHAEAQAIESETLKRLNQAKSHLLANVSHELRTPLTSIKGNIESLLELEVKWSKSQQREFLTTANQEADHLTLIIKNLLDMSTIDAGQLNLNRGQYKISEVLDYAAGRLKALTINHKLQIDIEPGVSTACMDIVRIAQVITNFVENAAKFSPQGSLIVIRVRKEQNDLIISVNDQGIGISQEELPKLFDRFYQVEQVVSGKTHGTGLGLTICKGIIEAHGGRLWVETELGQGSKFSFSIPL